MTNVAEVHLSMSENRDLARAFPKPFVAHMTTGSLRALLSDDEFRRLGIDPRDVERLRRAMADGTPLDEATAYVTDEMVDAAFIAGTPEECIQELGVAIHELSCLGFERISFAKLGPDFENALQLLSSELNLRRPA
jgi:alkanesulfonate monooxygenase SsuD/methylene tetrahydromethanopterin reductase-like flavin-dependent oxidoreductase (luciferase family)